MMLVLLASLTAAGALALNRLTEQRLSDTQLVNLSGYQRMLTQRIAWTAERLVHHDDPHQQPRLRHQLADAAQQLLDIHRRLNRWQRNGERPANDLRDLKPRLEQFVRQAQELASAPDGALRANNPSLHQLLEAADGALADDLNILTNRYQRATSLSLEHLQTLQGTWTLGGGLLMLLAMVQLVFRPVWTQLSARTLHLEQRDQALQRATRALATLRSAVTTLGSVDDETELLRAMCRCVVEDGGYRFAWVGYADNDPQRSIRPQAWAGDERGYLKTIQVSWGDDSYGQGPMGRAVRDSVPSLEREIRRSERFGPWRDAALEHGYESCVALPLQAQGRTIGALAVYGSETDAFAEAELGVLEDLATEIAYGIDRLRARHAQQQAETRLRLEQDIAAVLYKVLHHAQRPAPLKDKLQGVLDVLLSVSWLNIERKGAIFISGGQDKRLFMVAQRGLAPTLLRDCATLRFGHCLCGQAAASGELVFRRHMDHSHEVTFEGITDHGHYCQPICSTDGDVLGVLNLYVSAGHIATEAEQTFLTAVADTLAGILEREQSERRNQRLAAILEASPDFVCISDDHGNDCRYNAGARGLLGIDAPDHLARRTLVNNYPGWAARRLLDEAIPCALQNGMWRGDLALLDANGAEIPVSQVMLAQTNPDDGSTCLSTVAHDIRDRKRAEQAAQRAAAREKHFANAVINSLPGVFYMTNQDGQLLRWNANLESATGYHNDELSRMRALELVAEHDRPIFEDAMSRSHSDIDVGIEVELRGRNGLHTPHFITVTRVSLQEVEGMAVAGIGIDISYRKQLEEELRERATTDPLTGAFNRRRLNEQLEHEVQQALRYGTPLAVVLFDIDHFKAINDRYGHEMGDRVLQEVVCASRHTLRRVDFLGRWGGEEFMIVAPQTDLSGALRLAEKVRSTIADNHCPDIETLSASFGVAQYDGTESLTALIKRADDQLYAAKGAGRNRVMPPFSPPSPAD